MLTRQTGFILVTTLWILTALTVAIGFFSLWAQRAVELTQFLQIDRQGQIDAQSTQATLIFLLATQQLTVAGLTTPSREPLAAESPSLPDEKPEEEGDKLPILPQGNEIALDDRVYYGLGSARFALQDQKGLINLNFSRKLFIRLLGLLGVAGEEREGLLAKLDDYIDPDDLHRLNGAESYHYKQLGLPPPSNHLLRTPWEIKHVLGWQQQVSLWENNRWGQLTTVAGYTGAPNFNTAPALVLQSFAGVDAESAARIIQTRQIQPFYTEEILYQTIGVNLGLDPLELNFFPAESIRLTLWQAGATRMRQIHLQLTPFADQKSPWQIEYTIELPFNALYAQTPSDAPGTLFAAPLPSETTGNH